VPALLALCREQLQRRRFADDTGLVQISMALDEALANALHHGNLEVDSSLREEGLDRYQAEVERRRTLPPWRERRIHFSVLVGADVARYTVRDEGRGFDPCRVPDPLRPENLEKASGRGLLLMRTFMDEVRFNGPGNEVVLTKRRA
jgi:anti-sigma regulatory factor (Ser/Thr protein kinase)